VTSLDVPGQVAADNRPAEYGTPRVDLRVTAVRRSQQLARVHDVVGAYVGLTKPRIIELLLVTTVPAMFLAAGGVPPLTVVLMTMVGGCLAAASANAFNCVLDRDIDERMRRTRRRPIPRHAVGPLAATVFGVILAIAATLWLGYFVNWLSAALALGANAFYIVIYTLWLKRRTPQNIVWGGIAGCFPPLIGWTAVTGSLALPPLVMFLIVFFWTPPHTWALAMRYREDYAAANVPMLPVVRSAPIVARQIMAYAAVTVLVSLLLWPVAHTGWFYPGAAVILGIALLWQSALLVARAHRGLTDAALKPMRLFHWTNSYLALLFVAAAVDTLLR
jgi:protoheme IX farnesyltransferase